MSETSTKIELKTKEDYLSFMKFAEKLFDIDRLLDDYDIDVGDKTCNDFYSFLKKNKYITSAQNTVLLKALLDGSMSEDYDLVRFEDTLVCDSDTATLTYEEYDAMIAEFLSISEEDEGEALLTSIMETYDNLNWDYLLSLMPRVEFPELQTQDCECIISSKDLDALTSGIESLEEICKSLDDKNQKITLDIIDAIKTTLKHVE